MQALKNLFITTIHIRKYVVSVSRTKRNSCWFINIGIMSYCKNKFNRSFLVELFCGRFILTSPHIIKLSLCLLYT